MKRIFMFIVILLLVPALGLGEVLQDTTTISDFTEARGLADFMQEHYDITISTLPPNASNAGSAWRYTRIM